MPPTFLKIMRQIANKESIKHNDGISHHKVVANIVNKSNIIFIILLSRPIIAFDKEVLYVHSYALLLHSQHL